MSEYPDDLIEPKKAAYIIKKTADWLYRRRKNLKRAPTAYKIEGRYWYSESECRQFAVSQPIRCT